MPKRQHLSWLLLLLALGLPACARGRCPRPVAPKPVCRPPVQAPSNVSTQDEAIERATARTLARARAAEPATTALLERLATRAQGHLEGLEHRLKSPESTRSKYRRLLAKHPGETPDEIHFYDALRYTVVIPEIDAGHHRRHVSGMLQSLEQEGHVVFVVKNYWPRGDTYSGVNTTLRQPNGLLWELQFHTPESFATKSSTHDDYDVMRDPDTPLAEQQRLFDKMSHRWDTIPIPLGMLEPKAIHPKEVTRKLDRPAKAA